MGLGRGIWVEFIVVEEQALAVVVRMETESIVQFADVTSPHQLG